MNMSKSCAALMVIGFLASRTCAATDRFFDTLGHDEVELNFRYILHVSLYRRLTYAGRPPVNSAILATNATLVHYAKLHALMTQGSPITVRIFDTREEVAEWLGVPMARLT